MCGIFGFLGFQNDLLLKDMGASIKHRGPNSEGFFYHNNFAMGMNRLSIIDLESGDQPIYNEDKSLVICFNGEIYNYLEIKKELIAAGHHFQTSSDTEVIIHAYEEWGVDCLAHFNGMFAIALYDIRKKQLFLARDRSGQKPLYYYHQEGKFLFASEIKALLTADFIPRETNLAAIDAYLTLRYVPEPSTMFKNIVTLPAAHFLLLDQKGAIIIKRYWDISLTQNNKDFLSPQESLSKVEDQLRKSVNLVMRSDVPVGAYLSAGIDSSLLVALMSEDHANINTYSIGFNSAIDETQEAAETARLFGTNHHETHCTPEDMQLLPKVIYHMDRPVGDALIIAFYKLAAMASKDVKVVISGEGADEIFAGYQFHKVMQLFNTYFKLMPDAIHQNALLPLINLIPASFLNMFFKFPAALGNEGKQSFVTFLKHYKHQSVFANYIALKTLWRSHQRADLYTDKFKAQVSEQWIPIVRDTQGKFLDVLLKLQWDEWLQDWAIIRQDKNAMAHSLEVRLPFLDHHLIELGFQIPAKLKASWFKDKIIERILAKKILPPKVANRAKKPFYFPINHFYESREFNDLVEMTLNKTQVIKRGYFDPNYIQFLRNKMATREFIYLKQITSLVILELWHMIFIDKQFPS